MWCWERVFQVFFDIMHRVFLADITVNRASEWTILGGSTDEEGVAMDLWRMFPVVSLVSAAFPVGPLVRGVLPWDP